MFDELDFDLLRIATRPYLIGFQSRGQNGLTSKLKKCVAETVLAGELIGDLGFHRNQPGFPVGFSGCYIAPDGSTVANSADAVAVLAFCAAARWLDGRRDDPVCVGLVSGNAVSVVVDEC